ncbi:MAG: hypothetical protein AYP45_14900 [Candidatus Brocadia carolinensis]|uniref:Uncharacterized protein n=1 Tax=Candidatus Brocadia carolinensis TaxID=1004156 RepID=A0A1V4AQG4_9BACT|nr:MAG: hypothetical protein AYP45_14900 [Candidatus Brocadia caroliniensis]
MGVIFNNQKFLAQQSRTQFSVVKAGDCFGKDPRNDTGYALMTYGALSLQVKQSFSHKQSVPHDKE